MRTNLRDLYVNHKPNSINARLKRMADAVEESPELAPIFGAPFQSLKAKYQSLTEEATPIRHWMPKLLWNGLYGDNDDAS